MANGYAVIGDVHSCWTELRELLTKIKDRNLAPVFVGDFFDRGPGTIPLVKYLLENKPLACMGNHCNKLWRYLKGNPVKPSNGLQKTIGALFTMYGVDSQEGLVREAQDLRAYLGSRPPLLQFPPMDKNEGPLVVVHAAVKPIIARRQILDDVELSKRERAICYYGLVDGRKDENGFPVRQDFSKHWDDDFYQDWRIVHGHVVTEDHRPRIYGKNNNVVNVDTGCVFGGFLTAYVWKPGEEEHKFIHVKAKGDYYEGNNGSN